MVVLDQVTLLTLIILRGKSNQIIFEILRKNKREEKKSQQKQKHFKPCNIANQLKGKSSFLKHILNFHKNLFYHEKYHK